MVCGLTAMVCSCSGQDVTGPTAGNLPSPCPGPLAPLPAGATGDFQLTMPVSPHFIGLPSVTPEGRQMALTRWSLAVRSIGMIRGSIERVELKLRDRDTAADLGSVTDLGPFTSQTKCGADDPLMRVGEQQRNYSTALGFSGQPALLRAEVTVKDEGGRRWVREGEFEWRLFPPPVIKQPTGGITVRQNDPTTGCSFDPIHGYGIALTIEWDAPAQGGPVRDYIIAVADGAGTELIAPFYAHTSTTSYRMVRCNHHVAAGSERGARVAVAAQSADFFTISAYAVTRFNFQSCADAGVPACR